MKVAVAFDAGAIEDVRHNLNGWLESSAAGEMDGDEMLSKIGEIAEMLDDAIVALRRALGW